MELWRPAAAEAALSGFTSATAASGNDITSDTLGQSAASFAGPIGRSGLTHFSAAGEFSRQDRASPIISPIAPGSFVGHYRGWLALLRIDRQINDRNAVFFRGTLDGFHDTNPNGAVGGNNLPTVDRVFRRRTYSEALGETAVLSPTLLNSVRLQFQLASPIFVGFSGTYGNGAAPGPGFGAPLVGITNQLPARSLQFSVKLAF